MGSLRWLEDVFKVIDVEVHRTHEIHDVIRDSSAVAVSESREELRSEYEFGSFIGMNQGRAVSRWSALLVRKHCVNFESNSAHRSR